MGVLIGLLVVVFSLGGMFMSIVQLHITQIENKKLYKNNIILEQTNNELKLDNCCECFATSTEDITSTSTKDEI